MLRKANLNMTRSKVQHFVDGKPITKKEFLRRRDGEMEAEYVSQVRLLKNKIFTTGQIEAYEKSGRLFSARYKGKKLFKKEDVLSLIAKDHKAKKNAQQPGLLMPLLLPCG